eukprot:GHVL01013782.1.p1 GENE.GHVL01013782.1~~GHVL01013782.1.p1  ORF type:complete len:546 (+),score=64.89 GHVL01013782.1:61-1698(+)
MPSLFQFRSFLRVRNFTSTPNVTNWTDLLNATKKCSFDDKSSWSQLGVYAHDLLDIDTVTNYELFYFLDVFSKSGNDNDTLYKKSMDQVSSIRMKTMTADEIAIFSRVLRNSKQPCGIIVPQLTIEFTKRMQYSLSTPLAVGCYFQEYCNFLKDETINTSHVDTNFLQTTIQLVDENAESFSPSDTVMVLNGMASLQSSRRKWDFQPLSGDLEIDKCVQKLANTLPVLIEDLTPSQLAKIVYSLSKCRVRHEALFKRAGDVLRHFTVLGQLSCDELTNVAYSFGKLNVHHSVLMDMLSVQIRQRLSTFSMSQLAQIVASFSKLRVTSPVLTNRIAKMIYQRDALILWENVDGHEVHKMAMGYANLMIKDDLLFKIFSELLLTHTYKIGETRHRRLANFNAHELICIMHAWSKIHIVDDALFKDVSQRLKKIAGKEGIEQDQAVEYLHYCGKVEWREVETQMFLIEIIKQQGLENLDVFQILRTTGAMTKLSLPFPELEEMCRNVLPNEVMGTPSVNDGLNASWRGRRVTPDNRRKPSVRTRRDTF